MPEGFCRNLLCVRHRTRQLAVALAAVQALDTLGNAVVPRRYVKAHLDHLGVPDALRPALPMIKVATSAGLLVGIRMPRVGALTSAGLVAYYAAAVRFHLSAGDHPMLSTPAALLGGGAAVALLELYLPAIRGR